MLPFFQEFHQANAILDVFNGNAAVAYRSRCLVLKPPHWWKIVVPAHSPVDPGCHSSNKTRKRVVILHDTVQILHIGMVGSFPPVHKVLETRNTIESEASELTHSLMGDRLSGSVDWAVKGLIPHIHVHQTLNGVERWLWGILGRVGWRRGRNRIGDDIVFNIILFRINRPNNDLATCIKDSAPHVIGKKDRKLTIPRRM